MVEQVKRTGTGSTRRNMMRLYEKYAQREKRKIEDAADSLHGADELTYDATTESRSKLGSCVGPKKYAAARGTGDGQT